MLRSALGVLAAAAVGLSTAPSPRAVAGAQCSAENVLCVAPIGAPQSEFQDIQHAVDRLRPGGSVLVFPGRYGGFRVRRGGTATQRVVIRALGTDVVLDRSEPFSSETIYLQDVSWVTIEGFTVERGGSAGIGIGAHDALPTRPMHGLLIRNNVVRDSAGVNIYMSQVADSVIEGNVASGSRESHGIYLSNAGADNTVVRGNLVFDNAVNGMHFNGDQAETGDGLQTGLLVESNVVRDNRANGINMDGVRASTIRNNLVFRNARHALRVYRIDGAAGPASLDVLHNTFVDNGGWAVKLTDDAGDHRIYNNIFLGGSGSLAVDNKALFSDANVIDSEMSLDGERTVMTLLEWQQLGYDRSSFTATVAALFLDHAAADFRLLGAAPAVDRGLSVVPGVEAPQADLTGRPRVLGAAPDIGAFESSGVVSASSLPDRSDPRSPRSSSKRFR